MLAIVGAGAMGSALAAHCAASDPSATLFATRFDEHVVESLNAGGVHPALDVRLPETVGCIPHDQWSETLPDADRIIVAVSSAGLAGVVGDAAPHVSPDALWAVATKGWDETTHLTPSRVLAAELGDTARVSILGGPVLAPELIAGAPAAMVCAAEDPAVAEQFAETFRADNLRVKVSSDVTGVELCSAYKNVVAIAVGLCDGLADVIDESSFGHSFANARAAVYALGLGDMARLVGANNADVQTVFGLAGAGDLFVTCLGGRNGRYGRFLGSGQTPDQAASTVGTTVEGVANAKSAVTVAGQLQIDLPVATAVSNMVTRATEPTDALHSMLAGLESPN